MIDTTLLIEKNKWRHTNTRALSTLANARYFKPSKERTEEELTKISLAATRRTEKCEMQLREYHDTEYYKMYKSQYCKTYIHGIKIPIYNEE